MFADPETDTALDVFGAGAVALDVGLAGGGWATVEEDCAGTAPALG